MLPLNDKEQQIIELVCKGKSTDDVAVILGLTHSGVASHLRVIYPKLDAKNRAEACANFMKMQK